MDTDLQRKNKRVALSVLAVVLGMTGLAFASVPLYDIFCRVTGWGGTTQVAETLPDTVTERKVTIRFNADTARDLPWKFGPETNKIPVNVGQKGFINFTSRNMAARPTVGTAIYNVTPPKVGKYFNKIQCFCFDNQMLKPGQSMNMPVIFFLDPEFAKDENMDDVQTVTLSYTFFKSDSSDLDQALDAFYNQDKSDKTNKDLQGS